MDLLEQQKLAQSYNLSTSSEEEIIQRLSSQIKQKFSLGQWNEKKQKEIKRSFLVRYAEEEFNRLVNYQGLPEEDAIGRAMDYAKELWKRTETTSSSLPPYHIWTIEKEIDNSVVQFIVSTINKKDNTNIKLYIFDAKVSSLDEYKSILRQIEASESPSVLLIKNFTLSNGTLFEWLRDDIKNGSRKSYYTIASSPLIVPEEYTENWDAGMGVLQTVLITV